MLWARGDGEKQARRVAIATLAIVKVLTTASLQDEAWHLLGFKTHGQLAASVRGRLFSETKQKSP